MKTRKSRRLSGTKEWAERNINIQRGCEHGCRYCYARYDAVNRFKKCSAEAWAEPVIDEKKVDADYRFFSGRIMFPSAHDITPRNLSQCLVVIRKLLDAGNQLLIVSKPHWSCITLMCETLKEYRRQITFRFTIGSAKDDVLHFWEPNAPNFEERISCLQYAFEKGYSTSVSCEPFLDPFPHYVYDACRQWLTDSFWLGLLRRFEQRVDIDGVAGEKLERFVVPLKNAQSDQCIRMYYDLFKNKPYIKFKDSIREVIESQNKSK